MINNKLVTIVKDNQFDKGWTLFSPASFEVERNFEFKNADLSNVVKLITFSTQVNLVLFDACLPSRVLDELEWSNKYIKLNIIAKNEEILKRYERLSFNSCKIDESLAINYIGIIGKTNGYYILGDDLSEIDESIENIYFNSKKPNDKYSFLEKAKTLIICNSGKHKDFDNIISLASKYGVNCRYVICSRYFDKSTYDFAKENKIELFISSYVDDVTLVVNKDNSICKVSVLNDRYVVLYPIDKVSSYLGDLYKNLFLKDAIEIDNIPSNVYSCFNGKNEQLNITDAVVIKNEVAIKEMSDFVKENFDKSITEKHNEYSNKARTTKYFFTLIPPIYDTSYKESSIYKPIYELRSEWSSLNKINFVRIVRDYIEFMDKNSKLISFINYSQEFTQKVEKMVNKCLYSGYYSMLDEAISFYDKYHNHLLDDCLFMFYEINSESSCTKFDKFDAEIEGYRKTIREKEALVSMGTDVLSNKRRIEILNKKIDNLLDLKEKFEVNASSRLNKEADSFISYCKKFINGAIKSSKDESDSIGKIVNTSEESKLVKLNSFVSNYLKQINDYIINCIACLKRMKSIDIPEDYPVYEKDNQKYIVIDNLNEFDTTKNMCEKFSLKCLARR